MRAFFITSLYLQCNQLVHSLMSSFETDSTNNSPTQIMSITLCHSLDTSGTPTVPRRGSRRAGASRAPRGTPQTSTRLFPESVAPTFEFSTSACKRRGRAGVAAEPLCASPRFRPLFRFSFQPPMALIIGIIYVACTRLIFWTPSEIVPYSVRSS